MKTCWHFGLLIAALYRITVTNAGQAKKWRRDRDQIMIFI